MFQKNTLLLFIFFLSCTLKAQTHSIVIFSAEGNPFYLMVNDEKINKIPESNVKVFNVSTGWKHLNIVMIKDSSTILFNDSILLNNTSNDVSQEYTYALLEEKDKLQLVYKSTSEPSGPEHPPVPEKPKVIIPLIDNSVYGNLYKAQGNKALFLNNYNKSTSTCSVILNADEIDFAIALISKTDDENKFNYLTQIVEKNCFSSNQLNKLLPLLPIDIDRLSIVKKAYTHITDIENIKTMLPAFKYEAMKQSFLDYIKEQEYITKQKKIKCKEQISSKKFEEIFITIKIKTHENEKLLAAKKLISEFCISTEQAKSISQLFMHDREKLEFLKSAYYVLNDRENSTSLENEFQLSETKKEFLNYISH